MVTELRGMVSSHLAAPVPIRVRDMPSLRKVVLAPQIQDIYPKWQDRSGQVVR
jgi:hypothetical protein